MPIEIRELVIKVRIEENSTRAKSTDEVDLLNLKNDVLRECRKEIKKELNRSKER